MYFYYDWCLKFAILKFWYGEGLLPFLPFLPLLTTGSAKIACSEGYRVSKSGSGSILNLIRLLDLFISNTGEDLTRSVVVLTIEKILRFPPYSLIVGRVEAGLLCVGARLNLIGPVYCNSDLGRTIRRRRFRNSHDFCWEEDYVKGVAYRTKCLRLMNLEGRDLRRYYAVTGERVAIVLSGVKVILRRRKN